MSNRFLILFLYFGFLPQFLPAQITGHLTYQESDKSYLFSIQSEQTLAQPKNITNTGQITIKAITNTLDLEDFISHTGIWQLTNQIKGPAEAPQYDYFVFNLATPLANPNYQANRLLPLFSFKNKKVCGQAISIVENFNDEFWPPNSQNANIGNQLTILEFGINNAYAGNDPENNTIECPSILAYNFHLDSIKCKGENSVLQLNVLDAYFPFHYEIWQKNELLGKGSFNHVTESLATLIPEGQYQILGYDQKDSIQRNIELVAPDSLKIELLEQQRIKCNTDIGGIIAVKAKGGNSAEYQFKWSNGATEPKIENLAEGNYMVSLTDANYCETTKAFVIEADTPPQIDSIDQFPPTCHNFSDGIIEFKEINKGTPPFQYAIKEDAYQSDNIFFELNSGTYELFVRDANECVTTLRIILENPPKLAIENPPLDTFLLKGQKIILASTVTQEATIYYNWSPPKGLSCTDCPSPLAQPLDDEIYLLNITDENGCEASKSYTINVLSQTPIFAPNIFSPNSDGQNDLFELFIGPTISHVAGLEIYNRWGQMVFSGNSASNTQKIQWDGYFKGQLVDSGVYIYVANILYENGRIETLNGDFFLLK